MSEPLLRTPLYCWHAAHGARLVGFAGWEMPVLYSSIVDEHTATRKAAGLFDISHMGRLFFAGAGATEFLDRLLTNDVLTLEPGQARYALITNECGGVLDDVLVYRLGAAMGAEHMMVVNASNRQKIVSWIAQQLSEAEEVKVEDRTADLAMIAVQGPRSLQTVQPLVNAPIEKISYYRFAESEICGARGIVSRTGYTGEDGVELIVPSEEAEQVWNALIRSGTPAGLKPAGLGARDTLRLEAGMALYGHELTEQINPLEAGLGFAVKLGKRAFIGKEALLQVKQRGLRLRRMGLELEGRRIARQGYEVKHKGRSIGRITSGTFSPTLQKSIAMAYGPAELAEPETQLAVDLRGHDVRARVTKLPFYKRK